MPVGKDWRDTEEMRGIRDIGKGHTETFRSDGYFHCPDCNDGFTGVYYFKT